MPLLPSNRKTRLLALPINLVELLAKKYKRKHVSNSENGSRTIKRHKSHKSRKSHKSHMSPMSRNSRNSRNSRKSSSNSVTIKARNSKSGVRDQTSVGLFGGKILGEGGVSIILSDPRLPSIGESAKFKFTDFHKNTLEKQVSRLRKPVGPNPNIEQYKKEAMYPFELLKSAALLDESKTLGDVDFMMNNFGLPSYFREFVLTDRPLLEKIDKEYIKSNEGREYYPNPTYFTNDTVNMYDPIINGEYPYHMIFDKALGDLVNSNKLNIGSIGTLLNYYKELGESIIPGINFLHHIGLAHFDIKVSNIFVYKTAGKIKFKLADFDLLSRIQDRVNNPESYPTSEMRADDYIYYPSVVDTYVYRKKILKLAHTYYLRKKTFLATKQEKEQHATMEENTKMSVKPFNLKKPIYAANNLESGLINTVTHDIEQDLKSDVDKFNLLSYKFYIKYMKTLGKTLSKQISIKQYYNLENKIKSLCMEHKLETMPLQSILHELAEIKHGVLTKEEYETGVISTETYYDTIEENATKIYKYFAPSRNLDALGFYSFIAKFTDIYSFCLVLLDLINSYVDYLISNDSLFSVQSDVDNIVYILQFIKTYQSVDVYLAPGENVTTKPVEPIEILTKAYAKFIKDLEIKIP